jgi:5-methylcytosine-specific restriction endonuclease McrA
MSNANSIDLEHTRLIPSEVKKEVWKRDLWKCVLCWSIKNLHFDHDLPFSKWGTSLTEKNIKLLCMTCNLKKSDKIE